MIDRSKNKERASSADPDPASTRHAPVKPTDQARAGVELGRMRWVLRVSMVLVALGLLLAWALGR